MQLDNDISIGPARSTVSVDPSSITSDRSHHDSIDNEMKFRVVPSQKSCLRLVAPGAIGSTRLAASWLGRDPRSGEGEEGGLP